MYSYTYTQNEYSSQYVPNIRLDNTHMIYNKLFIGPKSSLILFIARDNSFVNKNIKNSLLDKTSVQIQTCHFIAD